MDIITLFSIAVSLSMDAFAVSVCKGLEMKKINYFHMFVTAFFFGAFQAFMPLAGWFLGHQFEGYIKAFDHWIAFGLLSFIGGKMLAESFKDDDECVTNTDKINFKELTMLAVATSIDALAVGITFAFLSVNIGVSSALIGLTTFLLSCAGVFTGNRFGAKYKNRAETFGGIVLIVIGIKILLEHTGVI